MAIFKKTGEIDLRDTTTLAAEPRVSPKPKPAAPAPRASQASVIGPTMEFKGELTADEDLIIEGLVCGTITHHNKHLTVGKKGRVKADIHASSVIVLGQLVGDITSDGIVTLSKSADVVGNIVCGRIIMEEGARFKGSIDMDEKGKVAAIPANDDQTEAAAPEQLRSVPKKPSKAG